MASSILLPVKAIFDDKGIKDAQKRFGELGKGIKTALAGIGVGIGISALASGLKDAAKAAVEEQKSQALLANQLRNTTNASDAQIASVEASIAQMQLQASVADDEIRPAFAALTRATGSLTEATGLTSLALDIAAGTGKDLGSVTAALGKAYNGNTASLAKLVPSIKGAADPMKVLTEQFKGAAAAAADNDPFQRMTIVMGEMQEQLGAILLPKLNEFAEFLGSADFAISFSNLVVAIENAGIALDNLFKQVSGKGALQTIVDVAGAAAVGVAEIAFWLADVGTTIGYLVTAQWDKAGNQMGTFFTRYNKFVSDIYAKQDEAAKKAGKYTPYTPFTDPKGKGDQKTNPVEDYFKKIATDVAKQKAKIKLTSRGISEAFAESIIGSGKDWKKVYNNVMARNDEGIKGLQAQFRKTEAGYEEAYKIAKEAFDKELEAWKERKEAYDKQVEAIKNFKASMKDILKALNPLAVATREIGQFEQTSIDAFESISEALEDGLANGTVTKEAAAKLKAYATAESALLNKLGKDRDALVKKRGLASALIDDVKAGIVGIGNLSGLLDNTSRSVTTTVSKIVNGLSIATTRTVEETVGAQGYLGRLKDIVAKTKAFAGQLSELKALGLDKDLFKQIVEAGPSVGGELATEILKGGADSVVALNDTFAELQSVAGSVAEQTAVVMYGAGVDVTNGLVNGLLAEEQKIVDAAKALADAFTAEWDSQMAKLVVPTLPDPGPAPEFIPPAVFVPPVVTPSKDNKKSNTVINVNVKANPVNTKATGQAVVAAVNKFYQSSTGAAIKAGRFIV